MKSLKIIQCFILDDMEIILNKDYNILIENNNFLLQNSHKNKTLVINESMYSILKEFTKPNTIISISEKFNVNNDPIVNQKIENFIKDLIERKILSISLHEKELISDSLQELKINEVINDYIVLQKIKENKKGEIFLVKNVANNKKFIFKTINYDKIKDKYHDSFKKKFVQEYYFLNELKSEYIINTVEFLSYKKNDIIVMEFFDGISVDKYAISKTLNEKAKIIYRLVEGFSTIHNKGIFHGDIHPNNILVNERGDLKIIDFELANNYQLGENEFQNKGGNEYYSPPERMQKNIFKKFIPNNQFQSEVYQLGLIIYIIIEEKLLFKSRTWKSLFEEKQNLQFTYSGFLSEIISKCLLPNPIERFKDATDMLNHLIKFYDKKNI